MTTFDGSDKSAHWKRISYRIYNPTKPAGSFFSFIPGALVYEKLIENDFLDLFERSGEILNLDESKGVLNVTECFDCLDHQKTDVVLGKKTQKPIRIRKYEFVPSLIPESPLFKIPETRRGTIYCHEGILDEEDSFKSRYESKGLNGLKFELVWTN